MADAERPGSLALPSIERASQEVFGLWMRAKYSLLLPSVGSGVFEMRRLQFVVLI